ncbi:hypothetical protein ACW910_24370 (plasmid) [Burkholderia ambifaria]
MKITDDMLTGWFPPEVKPVHEGAYPTRDENGSQWFSYWDGYRWLYGRQYFSGETIRLTELMRNRPAAFQDRPWRGINKEPQRD